MVFYRCSYERAKFWTTSESDVEAVLWRHNTARQLRKRFWGTLRLQCCDFGTHLLRGVWSKNSLCLKRKPKAKLFSQNLASKKRHELVRTRRQVSWHDNEIRFHPHAVFTVNQTKDVPQHLFMRVLRWKVTVALSDIVTSFWYRSDILPSAGLRDLSEEKLLSCLNICFGWLIRVCWILA